MKKLSVFVLIAVLPFLSCMSLSGEKDKKNAGAKTNTAVVTKDTNIHYTGRFCDECHTKNPVKGGNKYLKFNGDYKQLCWCHSGMSPGYCHPLDIKSVNAEKVKVPAGFPIDNEKLTCNTCHDVYLQCQKRLFNKNSLRGAPYQRRTDFCFNCHEKDKYKKYNAHDQINDAGKLEAQTCLYCHDKKPDEKTATYEDVKFIGNIEILCWRCHMVAGNHSGNVDHLAIKPAGIGLQRMEKMKKKFNLILPLDNDGKMTCITCHNPHEKGVIPADKPAAMGADSKFRHRLPGRLCKECHQK